MLARQYITKFVCGMLAVLGILSAATMHVAAADQPAVARVWHGKTLKAKADAYEQYLAEGIKKFPTIKGNMGYQMMRLEGDPYTEFQVISYWESLESIKAYAGEDITKTRHLPRDAEFLVDPEPNVRNYALKANQLKP